MLERKKCKGKRERKEQTRRTKYLLPLSICTSSGRPRSLVQFPSTRPLSFLTSRKFTQCRLAEPPLEGGIGSCTKNASIAVFGWLWVQRGLSAARGDFCLFSHFSRFSRFSRFFLFSPEFAQLAWPQRLGTSHARIACLLTFDVFFASGPFSPAFHRPVSNDHQFLHHIRNQPFLCSFSFKNLSFAFDFLGILVSFNNYDWPL